jgi:hypothetical protein
MSIGQGSAEAGASVKPAGKRKRTKEPITGGAEGSALSFQRKMWLDFAHIARQICVLAYDTFLIDACPV